MNRTRTIHCACCGLEHDVSFEYRVSLGESDDRQVMLCTRCGAHRGDTTNSYAIREADHALMYKHALVDAQDDVVLAYGERDFYRDKMQAAYTSRELMVQVLSQVEDVHHYRGKRCACGQRGCRVAELLADPRVARQIRSYDEERRTLRELRYANPDAWTEKWDFIDESLVYPRHRRGGGRHRATG